MSDDKPYPFEGPLFLMVYIEETKLIYMLGKFDPLYVEWQDRLDFTKFIEHLHPVKGYNLIVTRRPVGFTDRLIPSDPSLSFLNELIYDIDLALKAGLTPKSRSGI